MQILRLFFRTEGGRSMRESLMEYCANFNRNEILIQWHPERNGVLTPDAVSYGSKKPIWWLCGEGHEWQSPPYARVGRSSRCPYCSGKKVAPGWDLDSLFPEIASQWHPVKNGRCTPDQVLPGSHKTVWWRCGEGHEWKAMVKSRTSGSGCPVCANRVVVPGVNDLKTLAPQLALQWHPTKNGRLRPGDVLCGSVRKVWWRCARGHEWQAEIFSRASGKGCPVCAGRVVLPGENDLNSHSPDIAAQWHPQKNGALLPSQVAVHSNRQVWWQCERGHEWKSTVYSRTFNRSGCPYCTGRKVMPGFNDLKTLEPKVAAQWHPTLNDQLEPTMVTPGCRKKVWWKCTDGHEWKAVIYSRTGSQKSGCPVCAGKTARRA